MNPNSYIRRITALLLLLVFGLSAIPKSYIHTALADHHDYNAACYHTSHKAACIAKAGVNCHFNQLVVELPFVARHTSFQLSPVSFLPAQNNYFTSREYCFSRAVNDGRGPPQLV